MGIFDNLNDDGKRVLRNTIIDKISKERHHTRYFSDE